MIRGINHVALATGDLERLLTFYRDAFGFEVVHRGGWRQGSPHVDAIVGLADSSARTAIVRGGNLAIELFEYASPVGKPGDPQRPACDHGYTHFCVEVDDIEAEYQRLLGCGMTFHAPPQPESGGKVPLRATYGRDPDGNIIELIEVFDAGSPLWTKGDPVSAQDQP